MFERFRKVHTVHYAETPGRHSKGGHNQTWESLMTRTKILIATSVALLTAAASAAFAQAIVIPSVTAVRTTTNTGTPDGFFAARIDLPAGKKVFVRCKEDGTGCQTRVE